MKVVIETKRLLLREFTPDDAELVYELNLDPEVTRYTLDPVSNMNDAQLILDQAILPQYALYNHGRWAVHVKSSMEFIGWCGLKFRAEQNEIDLGYRFKKAAWGRGYATEAAFACIKYGFEKLGMKRIVGRALPGNEASMKVLEKCGMEYQGEEIVEGLLHRTFVLQNPSRD